MSLKRKAVQQAVSLMESLIARGVVNAGMSDRPIYANYDSLAPSSAESMWREQLRRLGLRVLGSGCFGMVVEYKGLPGYVIKIAPVPTDGYPVFARWVKDVRDTLPPEQAKYLPDIAYAQAYAGVFIAVVEKLLPLDACPASEEEETITALSNGFWDAPEDTSNAAYRLGLLLSDARMAKGRGKDMHRGNFMRRGDTIVITDPWV